MYYYQVWVRSVRYRGNEPLTYSFPERLASGTIVRLPLRQERVLGAIVEPCNKPSFSTKPIEQVYDLPTLPPEVLKLGQWIQQFYKAPLGVTAAQFLPALFTKSRQLTQPAPFPKPLVKLPSLTAEQAAALAKMDHSDTYLLHGKTGSGKTRIYIELARQELAAQHSALILSPEIGLTSQLARDLTNIFQERVVVLHSQLTPAERQAAWLKILQSTEPLVVVGPRSALFSPLRNIGVIIIDEAHEPAYKQEQAPYYHATRVAAQLAKLHTASLVLGSATPAITDYFMAEQKNKPIIRLTTSALPSLAHPSEYVIVDLKNRADFSRSTYLSNTLLEAIEQAMQRGEQSLLYLNRRGTARMVLCDKCGWQATCPHCDLPLAYHGDVHKLQCHTCGWQQSPPASCPSCNQPSIIFRSIGTKAIVDEVQRLFPAARVRRFDTDNKKAERFEQHFNAVHAGEIDILVGTQLLAKGLDLPKLSTIGLVIADSSLSVPDFTAGERTYQLLNQVLGRIGRGHIAGRAIIQTYSPDHPLLKAAIEDNWSSFYHNELAQRRNYNFPPYCYLLLLTCSRASAHSAAAAAEKLKAKLCQRTGLLVEGPAPAFREKLQGKYRWQLVAKARSRTILLEALEDVPHSGWSYDIDPTNLL